MYDKINMEKAGFGLVILFLLCYFMMLFDFPNLLTFLLGAFVCLILFIKHKKLRLSIGACLLIITIFFYYTIVYGMQNAVIMGLPYVGILMYFLGDYLICEVKTWKNSNRLIMILMFSLVLGFTIHGFLNSYMFLAGYRTETGRHWYDFWMNIYLPATEQVIYFLPILSMIFPAIVYWKKGKMESALILASSIFFIYLSWISDSRMPIFIFPMVFAAQLILYLILEREKVKELFVKNRKLIALMLITGAVILFAVLFTDNPVISILKEKLGRDGGILGSDRFVAQRLALQQLFKYPMGGNHMELGRVNYAHNTWLDMANRAGLIPFFAFTAYTILTVYEMIRWLMQKEIPTERKIITAGIYLAFFLYYTVERGIEGSMHFMTPWFFMNGMVHGELSIMKEKINDYKGQS